MMWTSGVVKGALLLQDRAGLHAAPAGWGVYHNKNVFHCGKIKNGLM